MKLNSYQRAEVAELAASEGYKVLVEMLNEELADKIKTLTEPTKPYEQHIEVVTALQGEIRGMKWLTRKVNTVLEGKDD